jgi:hypothetical protein
VMLGTDERASNSEMRSRILPGRVQTAKQQDKVNLVMEVDHARRSPCAVDTVIYGRIHVCGWRTIEGNGWCRKRRRSDLSPWRQQNGENESEGHREGSHQLVDPSQNKPGQTDVRLSPIM